MNKTHEKLIKIIMLSVGAGACTATMAHAKRPTRPAPTTSLAARPAGTPAPPPSARPAADGGGRGTTLIDCDNTIANRAALSNPLCSPSPPIGTIGSGPSFAQDRDNKIKGGFVDAAHGTLVLAVSGLKVVGIHQGAIYTVDLKTGARNVISGYLIDPKTGGRAIGSGPDLWEIADVQPGSDGQWYALAEKGIARIDPATGNRTLVFDAVAAHDRTDFCQAYNIGSAFTGGSGGVRGRLAMESPTHFFQTFFRKENDKLLRGIFDIRIGKDGPACRKITQTGSVTIGKGADINDFGAAYFHDGKLWGRGGSTNGGTIFTVDPSNGDRAIVSAQRDVGQVLNSKDFNGSLSLIGDALTFEANGKSVLEVEDYTGTPCYARVDIASGNKSGFDCNGGPSSKAFVGQHPDGRHVLLASDWGVVMTDPLTERTNNLSY